MSEPDKIVLPDGQWIIPPLVFGDTVQIRTIKASEAELARRARCCGECDGEGSIICPACNGTGEKKRIFHAAP